MDQIRPVDRQDPWRYMLWEHQGWATDSVGAATAGFRQMITPESLWYKSGCLPNWCSDREAATTQTGLNIFRNVPEHSKLSFMSWSVGPVLVVSQDVWLEVGVAGQPRAPWRVQGCCASFWRWGLGGSRSLVGGFRTVTGCGVMVKTGSQTPQWYLSAG